MNGAGFNDQRTARPFSRDLKQRLCQVAQYRKMGCYSKYKIVAKRSAGISKTRIPIPKAMLRSGCITV